MNTMNVKQAYDERSAAVWRWSFDKLNADLLTEVRRTDDALVCAVALQSKEPPLKQGIITHEETQYMLQSIDPNGTCRYVPYSRWLLSIWQATRDNGCFDPLSVARKQISCIAAVEESIANIKEALDYIDIEVD